MSTMDAIRSAVASSGSGTAVDSNTVNSQFKPSEGEIGESHASVDQEDIFTAGESQEEGLLPDGDTPTDSDPEQKEPASSQAKKDQTSPDKEFITVTDETGRRRKVEINYQDRKALRKHVEMAHGARKWQAERDMARASEQKISAQLTDLKSNWDALEHAFQTKGEEGVIDLLSGRSGAFQERIQKEIARARFLDEASPQERLAFEKKEADELAQKEIARIRKENEEFRKKMEGEREAAELSSLESRVNPVFDRYRFAGKLGNEVDEAMFDEMLWNTAMKRLEPYEEKGLPISAELVNREFNAVAMTLRKRIGFQADKKAAKVVEQKKTEATENAQAAVKAGYRGNDSTRQEARDMLNSGNLKGLFQQWGKYGKVFNK